MDGEVINDTRISHRNCYHGGSSNVVSQSLNDIRVLVVINDPKKNHPQQPPSAAFMVVRLIP